MVSQYTIQSVNKQSQRAIQVTHRLLCNMLAFFPPKVDQSTLALLTMSLYLHLKLPFEWNMY